MAFTTTTLGAAVSATDTIITVASATSIAAGNRIVIDQEEMTVIQGYSGATGVGVLRGVGGTATVAHLNGAAVMQGIGASDFNYPGGMAQGVSPTRAALLPNMVDITATGATGSTAAVLPYVTPCLVTVTGVSGAGVNIPSGAAFPGAWYELKNCTTGIVKLYAVGDTINGTTGTTAVSLTATGNLGMSVICTEAGAWQTYANT